MLFFPMPRNKKRTGGRADRHTRSQAHKKSSQKPNGESNHLLVEIDKEEKHDRSTHPDRLSVFIHLLIGAASFLRRSFKRTFSRKTITVQFDKIMRRQYSFGYVMKIGIKLVLYLRTL